MKAKDLQISKLREANRELKKIAKNKKLEDKSDLHNELSETQFFLEKKDVEYKVVIINSTTH